MLAPFREADDTLRRTLFRYRKAQEEIAHELQQKQLQADREMEEKRKEQEAYQLQALADQTGNDSFQQEAEQVLDAPVVVHVAPLRQAPKQSGVAYRKDTYEAEVYDIKALAAAVGSGAVDVQALKPDTAWLRREAKQRSQSVAPGADLLPGVRLIRRDGGMSVRS